MDKAAWAVTVLLTFSAIGAAIGGWLIVHWIRLLWQSRKKEDR